MPQALGLSTWQWDNNIKSVLMLLAFPLLLLAMLWGLFFIMGSLNVTQSGSVDPRFLVEFNLYDPSGGRQMPLDLALWAVAEYWPIILGIAGVWTVIGYFFNSSMIRAATGARAVERAENPKLYNLLENLCISRGIPMPRLFIIDVPEMNAFASGIDKRSFSITVTQGLLQTLDDKETEAVLAHELSHILNRDVRLLIIAIVFTGMISFIAQMLWRNLRFASMRQSSNDKRGNAALFMLVAAIMMAIGYVFAILVRFALSRRREYMADAGSVQLTKTPEPLISALHKISGNSRIPNVPPEVEQLFIDNPPSFMGLFDTHPPIEDRIRVLRALGGQGMR